MRVATFKQRLLKTKIQYAIRKVMRWDSNKYDASVLCCGVLGAWMVVDDLIRGRDMWWMQQQQLVFRRRLRRWMMLRP